MTQTGCLLSAAWSEAVAGCGASDRSPNQPAPAQRQRREHVLAVVAPHVGRRGGPVVRRLLRKPPNPHDRPASFLFDPTHAIARWEANHPFGPSRARLSGRTGITHPTPCQAGCASARSRIHATVPAFDLIAPVPGAHDQQTGERLQSVGPQVDTERSSVLRSRRTTTVLSLGFTASTALKGRAARRFRSKPRWRMTISSGWSACRS